MTEGRRSMTNSGLAFVYCVRCLVLLSSIKLYIFLSCLVLFTFVISFLSKGFPYMDQIEESFIVMVYCICSLPVTSSTLSLISLF